MQSNELQLQRKEIELQRQELQSTREVLREQTRHQEQLVIEETLLQLLTAHNNALASARPRAPHELGGVGSLVLFSRQLSELWHRRASSEDTKNEDAATRLAAIMPAINHAFLTDGLIPAVGVLKGIIEHLLGVDDAGCYEAQRRRYWMIVASVVPPEERVYLVMREVLLAGSGSRILPLEFLADTSPSMWGPSELHQYIERVYLSRVTRVSMYAGKENL